MAKVGIRNLRKQYGGVEILKGIDLEIRDREFTCFLGPSGCGKSTLPVSYTHLDVYKRQGLFAGSFGFFIGPKAPAHFPGIAFLLAAILLACAWLVAWRYARPAAKMAAPMAEPAA